MQGDRALAARLESWNALLREAYAASPADASYRAAVREAAHDDYRFGAIVLGIVRSPQFQQKARFPASPTQTVADTRASSASTGESK